MRNDQLTGSVGDFIRAIALGSLTNMADAQLTACALLGIPQPNPTGTARAIIAEMEQPGQPPEAQALLSAARTTQDLYWSAIRNLEAFLEIEIDGTKDLRETD